MNGRTSAAARRRPGARLAGAFALGVCMAGAASVRSSDDSGIQRREAEHTSATEPAREPFDVKRHGFAFTNAFQGWPWAAESASAVGGVYGLCGGMSLAAADYYAAGARAPEMRVPPGPGGAWHAYLWVRQARSLGFMGYRGLRFMQWMALPDEGCEGTRARTRRALAGAGERMEREGVLPLGLVYRRWREGAVPWQNHQVLAYGWRDGADGVVEIRIYDPNFPGREDVMLRLTPTVEATCDSEDAVMGFSTELVVPGRRVRPVRGVFLMGHVARPVPGEDGR